MALLRFRFQASLERMSQSSASSFLLLSSLELIDAHIYDP